MAVDIYDSFSLRKVNHISGLPNIGELVAGNEKTNKKCYIVALLLALLSLLSYPLQAQQKVAFKTVFRR